MSQDSVTRFVITQQREGELRTLFGAAQGRNTYETKETAELSLKQILAANTEKTLASVGAVNLEVRPCECWPNHFDPKGIYFD